MKDERVSLPIKPLFPFPPHIPTPPPHRTTTNHNNRPIAAEIQGDGEDDVVYAYLRSRNGAWPYGPTRDVSTMPQCPNSIGLKSLPTYERPTAQVHLRTTKRVSPAQLHRVLRAPLRGYCTLSLLNYHTGIPSAKLTQFRRRTSSRVLWPRKVAAPSRRARRQPNLHLRSY